ncbi:MAG: hypothetical protein IIC39_06450 [Candidatus Marinimicrobia bacterium]|nr:hypothetical protein [Candidatus Neomarinimicrobiota bacterium]
MKQFITFIFLILVPANLLAQNDQILRISFVDPYWAYRADNNLARTPSSYPGVYDDSSFYYPQMKDMGITHVVSRGDLLSFPHAITEGISLLNERMEWVGNYVKGVRLQKVGHINVF